MTATIHPSAVVAEGAVLGAGVEIGPFCCVGPHVRLGDGVRLVSHVSIDGRTSIGEGTTVYPFASLGHPPQDLKFGGEPSTLEIGARNRIREHVTMNPGTEGGGMVTRVGDDGLFMVGSHIAHDCRVGNRVVMANNATLAGHVHVGDHAIIGGLAAARQFVRIGAHAMIGGMSAVVQDVIPFGLVNGERAHLTGLNLVGLERRGFGKATIQAMRDAYRRLFAPEGTLAERLQDLAASPEAQDGPIAEIVAFMAARSALGIVQPDHAI